MLYSPKPLFKPSGFNKYINVSEYKFVIARLNKLKVTSYEILNNFGN